MTLGETLAKLIDLPLHETNVLMEKSKYFIAHQTLSHSVNIGKLLRLSTYYCKLYFYFRCFEVCIAIQMDTTTNIFSVDIEFYNYFVIM